MYNDIMKKKKKHYNISVFPHLTANCQLVGCRDYSDFHSETRCPRRCRNV